MNWKKLEDDFDNTVDSDEYWNKFKIKKDITEKRYDKFETYLKNNDFDALLERLITEHSYPYKDKCYDNGHEPYPNNKLTFILDYIESRIDPIDTPEWIDCTSLTSSYIFNEYYFSNVYGQGVITRIHSISKELILSI